MAQCAFVARLRFNSTRIQFAFPTVCCLYSLLALSPLHSKSVLCWNVRNVTCRSPSDTLGQKIGLHLLATLALWFSHGSDSCCEVCQHRTRTMVPPLRTHLDCRCPPCIMSLRAVSQTTHSIAQYFAFATAEKMSVQAWEYARTKQRAVACVRCGAPYKKRKVDRNGVIMQHGYCTNSQCERIAMPSKRDQVGRCRGFRSCAPSAATFVEQIHSWGTGDRFRV